MDSFTLANMRSQYSTYYLPDTCTILTKTWTRSSTGRDTASDGTLASSVACRFMPLSDDEVQEFGAQLWPDQGYRVSMAYDGTLTPAHRIVYSGGTYAVVAVQQEGSWKVALRAIVREVKPQ